MQTKILRLFLVVLFLLAPAPFAQAFSLVPGNIYTAAIDSNQVTEYSATGQLVDHISLAGYTNITGLAFGPDGKLYAVVDTGSFSTFSVLALGSNGAVISTYSSPHTLVNDGTGKLRVGSDGTIYVGAGLVVVAFTPGNAVGVDIYQSGNSEIAGLDVLPSGNLLVLANGKMVEITVGGVVIRSIAPEHIQFVDPNGVEFDRATQSFFASFVGFSGQGANVQRVNNATYTVGASVVFSYPGDIAITSDRRVIVGSYVNPPGLFDADLVPIGTLGAEPQSLVAAMPVPPVPAPVAVPGLSPPMMFLLGIFTVVAPNSRRRNQKPKKGQKRGRRNYLFETENYSVPFLRRRRRPSIAELEYLKQPNRGKSERWRS